MTTQCYTKRVDIERKNKERNIEISHLVLKPITQQETKTKHIMMFTL